LKRNFISGYENKKGFNTTGLSCVISSINNISDLMERVGYRLGYGKDTGMQGKGEEQTCDDHPLNFNKVTRVHRVEATVALRVVRGDEEGTQSQMRR
jgi:hypothetical protein